MSLSIEEITSSTGCAGAELISLFEFDDSSFRICNNDFTLSYYYEIYFHKISSSSIHSGKKLIGDSNLVEAKLQSRKVA